MKHFIKIGLFLVSTLLFTGCAKEEIKSNVMDIYSYEQEKDSYVLENDNIKFTLDSQTTYFEVKDKSNDTTWYSNPINIENDIYANPQSKKNLQSTLLLEYSTDIGIATLVNNYDYSIAKQIYTIEEEQDYIKVNYSIGDTEKVYLMPLGIPESRMTIFMDKMNDKDKRQINSYYRKFDINKLKATDNKAELLTKYPQLEEENVYVLRDGLQDYLLAKIETIFEAAGYTIEDLTLDNAASSANGEKEKPFFNISVIYRLEGNELVVEVPFDNMEWQDKYPLTKLKVLPYLGAGDMDDSGYILVPEANGGIINFNNAKVSQSAYYSEMYGWDDALKRDAVVDDNRLAFPVFGIAKNGASILCLLEDKAESAAIEADISGRNNSYNYASATYKIIRSSSVDVSAKTDKSVILFEDKKPEGVIKQRYQFLNTDSYTKMAESYRGYLLDRYPSLQKKDENSTPVAITMVGAIDEVKQRFGFPVSMPIPLTTYKEAQDMLKELHNYGYKNLYVKYSGWMNGGIKQSVLENIDTISELGSKKELFKYLDYAKTLDIPVYLEGMTQYTYNTGWFDGFVINRDAAKHASREIAKLYKFSAIFYGLEKWNDAFYLVKPQLQIKYMQNLADYTKKHNGSGVAFTDVGYLLSADYNPKNLTIRQEVIEMQKKKLEEIASSGTGVMVKEGNDYVLPYVDFITDMDLLSGEYHIIDYMVPFYSIAIHGLVNYSGNSINLSEDYQKNILKSAESGAGLSFTYTKETTSILQDSNYTYYFGANYDLWADKAFAIYSRYEEELGHIFNQYIIGHERLTDGVFVTTYEDGTKVYVNYNDVDYTVEDLTVPAHDYKVKGR